MTCPSCLVLFIQKTKPSPRPVVPLAALRFAAWRAGCCVDCGWGGFGYQNITPLCMNSGRFAWMMPLRCWMGSLRVRMYLG